MAEEIVGVIGGSGLYAMDALEQVEEHPIETPFGRPSAPFVSGLLGDQRMVFLPRHGIGHRLLPHEINFRANILGMKILGVTQLISVSAVGSLQEEIAPGDLVLVDQFIDFTRHRPQSFFGEGAVCHVPMADPLCLTLRSGLQSVAQAAADLKVHPSGTYVCIEGPQFSTRAESHMFRKLGADVVGMTNLPEARLAREAEISYATIALATDYDCWHQHEEDVSVASVLEILRKNVDRARWMIAEYSKQALDTSDSPSRVAARTSLLTPSEDIPAETRRKLSPILDQFLTK